MIKAVEAGTGDLFAMERVAGSFGLDLDSLAEGRVEAEERSASAERATVFLLQGPMQDFDCRDLDILMRALHWGRALSAQRPDGLKARLGLWVSPVSGPERRDAARQGYALAGALRSALGLGVDAIGDIRAILEDSLAVAVAVGPLWTPRLRAAGVLDAHRAGAVALLSARDMERSRNPLLARVYLAHEACHLLYDPCEVDSLRIALDEHATSGGQGDLYESRAKGFAAEFLLPRQGLVDLLGEPSSEGSGLDLARKQVDAAREHFGTPWEIAVNHLCNHGWFDRGVRIGLLTDRLGGKNLVGQFHTTLPVAGRLPRALSGRSRSRAPHGDDPVSRAEVARGRAIEALVEVREAASVRAELLLQGVYEVGAAGNERATANALIDRIDDLLHEGAFAVVHAILEMLDVRRLPPSALSGALVTTSPARDELKASREALGERMRASLTETPGWGGERVERLLRRVL